MQKAENLKGTCPDERGYGPDYGASLFACHKSKDGAEIACAGWLAVAGKCHPGVRIAVTFGRLDPKVLEAGEDWPELHKDYGEVLEKLRDTY